MRGFEAAESRGPAVFVPDPGPTSAGFVAPTETAPEEAAEPVSDEALEEAYQRGFEAGEASALDRLPLAEADALNSAAQVLNHSAQAFQERARGMVVAEPRSLVELALSISEHVLQQQLGDDADALIARVSRAITTLPEREPVRIEVSNQDYAVFTAAHDALDALAVENIEIEAHAGLGAGEFRLVAGATEVDGRLTALLSCLREALAEECGTEDGAE